MRVAGIGVASRGVDECRQGGVLSGRAHGCHEISSVQFLANQSMTFAIASLVLETLKGSGSAGCFSLAR